MAQNIDPVFGSWNTTKQVGTGTDGKVFLIQRDNIMGVKQTSALKIIRIGENKTDIKTIYQKTSEFTSDEEFYKTTIKNITDNIDIVMKTDAGKYFVNYEEYEKRPASDGKGWIVLIKMEQMKSLSHLLEDFSFTHDEVVRLGISICKSLMKCRSFGYIYPNLKPENVLFNQNGICKLGDFGTFSLLESSKAAVAYKRTQYYMAPEFIKSTKVNCTVDTYSLGLILYMLVNRNRLPFVPSYPESLTVNSLNESMEKRMQGLEFPAPALSSKGLNKIINKACNPKENKRYISPDKMLGDLEKLLKKDDDLQIIVDELSEQKERELIEKTQQQLEQSVFVSATQDIQKIYTDFQIKNGEHIKQEEFDFSILDEEKKENETNLSDEIQIPDITNDTYHSANESKTFKKYAKLPTIKRIRKDSISDKKKVIILSVLVAVLFVIFLTSLSLFIKNQEAPQEIMIGIYNVISKYERCDMFIWQVS